MISACPNCKRRVEPKARYCPDCYTVFPSDSHASRGPNRYGKGTGGSGSKIWKFALIFFAAIFGAWFYAIDTEDWSAEPGSFAAFTRDLKRQVINAVGQVAGSSEADEADGRPVEQADVRQARGSCAIAQTVSNQRDEAVAPVIVSFSFRGLDGTVIGQPVSGTVAEEVPAGASRDLTFRVPCPEVFASVHASAEEGIGLSDSARLARAVAEERIQWFLENDHRLPCAFGAACEVVIRFNSGDSATYLVERRNRGGTRFFATDQRGIDLLSAATRAALLVGTAGGDTRTIPITREDDERWTIAEGERLSATERGGDSGGL